MSALDLAKLVAEMLRAQGRYWRSRGGEVPADEFRQIMANMGEATKAVERAIYDVIVEANIRWNGKQWVSSDRKQAQARHRPATIRRQEGDELHNGWQPAVSMPGNTVVVVRTVKGLVRLANRSHHEPRDGHQHCWKWPKTGDLTAVAWRPCTDSEFAARMADAS